MFINMSNFEPKSGKSAEFREFFVTQVLPVTLAAKGLVSAEIYSSPDGIITNIEHWESESAWKALTEELLGRTDLAAPFEGLVEKFWEYPLTSLKSFKAS